MRQSELSASPKPDLFMPKLHHMEQSLQRGRSTFLKAHRASPYQHHCTTASKGGGDKTPSEPCHTGHGVLVKPRKQEGQRLLCSHRKRHCCTLQEHLCAQPICLGTSQGCTKAVTVPWSREGHTYYWGTWPFCLALFSSCCLSWASACRDCERRSGARLALQALCLMKSMLLPCTCICKKREPGIRGRLGTGTGPAATVHAREKAEMQHTRE